MISATPTERAALLLAGLAEQGALESMVRTLGYLPIPAAALDVARLREPIALCIVDLQQNGEALRTARAVRAQCPDAVVIAIADPERPATSADAIRAGVFDVLPRPASSRDLEALIANAREQASLAARHSRDGAPEPAPYGIVGTSAAMRLVLDLVHRAAAGRCGILIVGERGTGREMIARAIHEHAPDPAVPFVKVDCSDSAADVELELFGVAAGRGGSADRRHLERVGPGCRLLKAHGGILFLENVVALPSRAQGRLVRVLRDREVFLSTQRDPVSLDIRPIASIDGAVDAAVDDGRLRPDLFERLSLVRVDVPALRHRREDIPVLATHFLKQLCQANGRPLKTLTRPALTLLSALPWRGNAPELRSLLERLVLLVPHGLIRLEDVLAHTKLEGTVSPMGVDATLRQARARFERDYIAAVLQHQHGRIPDAARVLGIQRTNLYRKMRRLNLTRGRSSRES